MRNEKYSIWPVFMAESPKCLHHIGNRRRRTRWWRQILTESRNKTVLRIRNEKYAIWPLVMAESPKLLHSSAMDLWTRLWGRYHDPQKVFLVNIKEQNSKSEKNVEPADWTHDTWTYFTAIRKTSRCELLRSSEDGICFLRPSKQSFRTALLKFTKQLYTLRWLR